MLRKIAGIVMKNTGSVYNTALGSFSSAEGDLRLLNVTAGVGGSSYMNFSKVPTKLGELCDSVNVSRKQLAINDIIGAYKLSFDAHFQLVTIHPWADGNGRMSRLFMNRKRRVFLVFHGLSYTHLNDYHSAIKVEIFLSSHSIEFHLITQVICKLYVHSRKMGLIVKK